MLISACVQAWVVYNTVRATSCIRVAILLLGRLTGLHFSVLVIARRIWGHHAHALAAIAGRVLLAPNSQIMHGNVALHYQHAWPFPRTVGPRLQQMNK